MGDLSRFVMDSVKYYLYLMEEEEGNQHKEDSRLVWPSHVAKCPKKSALRRASDIEEDFSFDTKLRMLIGSMVGKLVAIAMERAGDDLGYRVNSEEAIKTMLISGRMDIQFGSDAFSSIVEVKYSSFFYPGFSIDHFCQICTYMQAQSARTGVLCMVYNTGGMKCFEVVRDGDNYYAYKDSGEAVTISYDTTLPVDDYGNVCISDKELTHMITDRKQWLDDAFTDYDRILATPGPAMNIGKIPFDCAWVKPQEYYKTNRPNGQKVGDKKGKGGTIKCNCPFFDSCYNGWIPNSERMVEGLTYEWDGQTIGSEVLVES